MKKIISLLLLTAILFSFSACQTKEDFTYGEMADGLKSIEGANPQNILTGGFAARTEHSIYYTSRNHMTLFRMDRNGDNLKQVISGFAITSLNVYRNTLYFVMDGHICRMNNVGNAQAVLYESEFGVYSIYIADDYIFYKEYTDDTGENMQLCVMPVQGGEGKVLLEESSPMQALSYDQGMLYVNLLNEEGGYAIAALDPAGESYLMMYEGSVAYLQVVDGYCYMHNYGGVYRLNFNDSEDDPIEVIPETSVPNTMNVAGDYIYYLRYNEDENDGIYRVKTDGSARRCLVKGVYPMYNVVGDWIFYCGETDTGFSRVRIDGQSK